MKRYASIIITVMLMLSIVVPTYAMETVKDDIKGHWAEVKIREWKEKELVKGYPDGTFRPDDMITKGELITLVNRIYGYYEKADENYSDIKEQDWCYDAVSIAKANKYMEWYQEKELGANKKITRQEVCAIIASIHQLEQTEELTSTEKFSDKESIPDWSKGYVDAVVNSKYMIGYPDNTIKAEGNITRAEVVTMLDRVVGELINIPGVYGSEEDQQVIVGNLIINTQGVTLKNTIINGSLMLAAGIGQGEVDLENVTVKGKTIINGGGENSITFKNSNLEELVVFKFDGKIRVVSSDSTMGRFVILSSLNLVKGRGSFGRIEILGQGSEVKLDGKFEEPIIMETQAEIVVTEDSEIQDIIFNAPANVTGKGKINKVTLNSNGVNIEQEVSQKKVANGINGNGVKVRRRITRDTTAPRGYNINIDQSYINSNNENDLSFTFSGAEIHSSYNYSIDDTNASTPAVAGNGKITATNQTISGINVSSLDDDSLTLTVYLTDTAGNQGSNVIKTVDKETVTPDGYNISIVQNYINSINQNAMSFKFTGAEIDATCNYSIDDTNVNTPAVTGSKPITAEDQTIVADVSSLDDDSLTLTVYLTDEAGNLGSDVSATVTKETVIPSGYSVSIDPSQIDTSNVTALSFTFSGAEPGATYNYTITSDGGGTDVQGNGSISSASEQVKGIDGKGIDVSGLNDGELTLTVTLTDTAGNKGIDAEDTKNKDATPPSDYDVTIDHSYINQSNKTAMSFTFTDAELGATCSYTINDTNPITSAVSDSKTITDTDQTILKDVSSLDDGDLTLTVNLTDAFGNQGNNRVKTVNKDTVTPSLYRVSVVENYINSGNENSMYFEFAGAEIGTTYNYTITSDGGGTDVQSNGIISSATEQVTEIDVSGLNDGELTLSVTLTDEAGNQGSAASAMVTKETVIPSDYSVSIDQSQIDSSNVKALSFTFSEAEIGTTYNYTITSNSGGTDVQGNGSISSASEQVKGIDGKGTDVSGLNDGELTLTVTLTDTAGNEGIDAECTVNKDATPPSSYDVAINQSHINPINESEMSFTFTDAELGATCSYTINDTNPITSAVSDSITITDIDQTILKDVSSLDDGDLTLTVYLTDTFGNQGGNLTRIVNKDTVIPDGYIVDIVEDYIYNGNQNGMSFEFDNAEIGTTYRYSIDDTNGTTTAVTGSDVINEVDEIVSGINVSLLDDDILTLTVYLTDEAGNQGSNETDTVTKDTIPPNEYSIAIDQTEVDSSLSFTFSGAEPGTTYDYTISSDGGGNDKTGTGNVSTATDQVAGIDVSGLNDGTLTLTVYLTDVAGNQGLPAEDTVPKSNPNPNLLVTGYSFASGEGDGSYVYNSDGYEIRSGSPSVTENRYIYIKDEAGTIFRIIWVYEDPFGWAWELQKYDGANYGLMYYNENNNSNDTNKPPETGWINGSSYNDDGMTVVEQ